MKRERLEDLGRIRVLLENIVEIDLFDFYHGRNKDFEEWFREQTPDRQNDLLHEIIYGIDKVLENLNECICIARGHDED